MQTFESAAPMLEWFMPKSPPCIDVKQGMTMHCTSVRLLRKGHIHSAAHRRAALCLCAYAPPRPLHLQSGHYHSYPLLSHPEVSAAKPDNRC